MDIVSALTGTTAQVVYFLFCVVAAIATTRRSVVEGRPARIEKEGKKKATVNRTITKNKDHARHASLSFARRSAGARHPHLVGVEARTACVWINDPAMLATEGPKHRRVRSAPPDQLRRCKTVARYASAPRVGAPPQASGLSRL